MGNDQLPTSEATDDPVTFGRDILVVDDNEANLVAIEAALQPLGRPLVLARSGLEALSRLLERDFVLVILDVAMPGIDGFETARLIRARPRNRTTPILFVTGLSWEDDEVIRGYELGALDFLIKPIRAEVLRAKASVLVQLQERTFELHQKAEELRIAQARSHERELTMQRRRFEADALAHQMQQLAETDRRKDEFLAILAHELRNPLQPLQTAVEIMDLDTDKPLTPRVRSIIQRQVHHIGRLVDDLLDVARFQTGRLELRRELIVIDTIVDEAMAEVRSAADARGHRITVIGESATSPTVFGDPLRLVQVVTNLLSNAIKYTEPSGEITVVWGHDEEFARVRITDNGRGIQPEMLPRIFDMFVQERVGGDGAGGLGLGLGLAKRLVDLHHGALFAESAGPGTGSSFELRLPLATNDELVKRRSTTGVHQDSEPPLNIVVVDDAPDLRDLVADLLRMRGHDVATANDGPSAVELIRMRRPDVALIDIGLPGMDGYEIARALRTDLPRTALRLIAMTGYGQASDRSTAFQAGFDDHIVKPARAETITRALYGRTEVQ